MPLGCDLNNFFFFLSPFHLLGETHRLEGINLDNAPTSIPWEDSWYNTLSPGEAFMMENVQSIFQNDYFPLLLPRSVHFETISELWASLFILQKNFTKTWNNNRSLLFLIFLLAIHTPFFSNWSFTPATTDNGAGYILKSCAYWLLYWIYNRGFFKILIWHKDKS